MNERIKQLETQAFDAVWDLENYPIGPGTHFQPNGFEQKFAELIIRECASKVTRNEALNILEHFGVKE